MTTLSWLVVVVLAVALLEFAAPLQRRRPPSGITKGVQQCRKSSRRRFFNWGTSELWEAKLFEKDGETELEISENGSGVPVFKLEVGSTYQIRIGFKPKEFPKNFGAVPKFFGIKITEDYTAAPFDSQQAFQSRFGKPLLGKHECSPSLGGGRAKDSDGCQWITEDSESSCEKDGPNEQGLKAKVDSVATLQFPFVVPNFPLATTNTSFRLIPTVGHVTRGGCSLIGQPGGTETLIDDDMICIKYPTLIVPRGTLG